MKSLFCAVALLSLISFPSFAQVKTKYDTLEVVISGSISIYRSASMRYYLENSDTLIHLPGTIEKRVKTKKYGYVIRTDNRYRNLLSFYLHSCKSATTKIESMRLTETDLIRVMSQYYKCTGEEATFIESGSARSTFTIGPAIGVNFTGFNVTSDKDKALAQASWQRSTGAVLGLTAEYLSIKSKFGVGAQFNSTSYSFSGSYYNENSTEILASDFETDIKQYQLQVYLKKYFGTEDLNVFVKFGPSVNLNTIKKAYRLDKQVFKINDLTYETPTDPFYYGQNGVNLLASVGGTKSLSRRLSLSFEVRGETMNRFSDHVNSEQELYSYPISLFTGLHFQL